MNLVSFGGGGVHRNFSGAAQIFFYFPGGGPHSLGPENHLETIDFTDPGGRAEPPEPPVYSL